MAEYARIERVNDEYKIILGVTKCGKTIPYDVDASHLQKELKAVLDFVQSFEDKDVELAFMEKEKAKKEAEEAKRKAEEAKREQARLQAELEAMKRDMEESYVLKEPVDETTEEELKEE